MADRSLPVLLAIGACWSLAMIFVGFAGEMIRSKLDRKSRRVFYRPLDDEAQS